MPWLDNRYKTIIRSFEKYRHTKTSVEPSQKYLVYLNWIKLATHPTGLVDKAAVSKPEDASSYPPRDNEFLFSAV